MWIQKSRGISGKIVQNIGYIGVDYKKCARTNWYLLSKTIKIESSTGGEDVQNLF